METSFLDLARVSCLQCVYSNQRMFGISVVSRIINISLILLKSNSGSINCRTQKKCPEWDPQWLDIAHSVIHKHRSEKKGNKTQQAGPVPLGIF
jgi:hypothetical protein